MLCELALSSMAVLLHSSWPIYLLINTTWTFVDGYLLDTIIWRLTICPNQQSLAGKPIKPLHCRPVSIPGNQFGFGRLIQRVLVQMEQQEGERGRGILIGWFVDLFIWCQSMDWTKTKKKEWQNNFYLSSISKCLSQRLPTYVRICNEDS